MHSSRRACARVDDLLTLSALESEQNALQECRAAVARAAADARALSAGQHVIELDLVSPPR
jgi:hypothetical protein